jgi:hypothetical protein
MRNRDDRTITQAIIVYLFWLKNGIDQTTISAIFGIKCQQDVSRYLAQAREGLASFVEKHIGPKVLSREQLIRCNSNIAVQLFLETNQAVDCDQINQAK